MTTTDQQPARRLLTLVAPGATPGRLLDIARQAFPGCDVSCSVGGCAFSGTPAECARMGAELDARGIAWGWQ